MGKTNPLNGGDLAESIALEALKKALLHQAFAGEL